MRGVTSPNLLYLYYFYLFMEQDKDISVLMADDALKYIYEKYPNLTCGDYLSFSSVLTYNVAQWIANSMKTDIKEVINVIFSQCIQLEMLKEGEEEND